MTAVNIVFTCTNATSAGSTHGAGINSIVITGTPDTSSDNRTATTLTLGEHATTGTVGETLNLPTATVQTADGAPVESAAITWTSSNEEVATIGTAATAINLLKAGTTTIKAQYEGDNTYKPSTASFTLTVTAGAYTSLAALQQDVTSTSTPVTVNFNNVFVTAVKGSNAYLADADGYGVLVYQSNHGLEAGQVLNGSADVNLVLYRGQTELTGFSTSGLTITTAELTPTVKTIDQITSANQSTLVTLKNVTYSDGKLSDGTNEITYYDNFGVNATLEEGKAYDITGIVILYNTTIEIAPRTADDIAEATAPVEPTEPVVLTWDYTETMPAANPDNGLYYESSVNDPAGANMGLKGVKLNSSGYAFFAKPAVAGTLTLTFGNRKSSAAYAVNVYACTITEGAATKGDLIGDIAVDASPGSGSIDIAADVTGIYIERKTGAEGVLQKIVFKETVARSFVDFEITNGQLKGEFDATTLPAGVTFTGTQRNDSHGYGNVTLVVPVDGTVKFTIGGCQYANPATCKITNAQGELLAEPNLKTATCYHQDGAAATYIYTGEPTTLTFSNIAYLPYFKAEATEVSEATVTYRDQNDNVLGTKTVFEGDPIGDCPYTEADLTIPAGEKFRGWIYANEIKVKPTDIVNGNVTVKAKVTPIETVTVGSVQTYDLTVATFYPEDHETFSVEGGSYYNNHGFNFAAGGSFAVEVAGKAQVVLSLCQYGNGTTIKVTDAAGNVIRDDVPAKAENDGGVTTVTYDGDATTLTFTFEAQAYLHSVTVYNVTGFLTKDESGYYIVPAGDAASLLMAINSANSEEGAKIFLPDGTYDLGEKVKTIIAGKNVSLIGQSAENTIIVNSPSVAIEGLDKADLLKNTGEGLYMQDLSLKNNMAYGGNDGRAASLHDTGTKTICKNVFLLSHQDTYYSHKVGGLYYFDGGELHGTVDYLCGNGKVYYNEVKLVNEQRSSATITANSELYVFNNCTVENNANSYNLGRAWSDNPVCVFLNTTLLDGGEKLIATRWNLTGINCDYSVAGEYGTKDANGQDITPASNNITFAKQNTQMNTILDATALETYSIQNVLGDWAATAQQSAKQVAAPADAQLKNGMVTWSAVEGATAYALFKNGTLAKIVADVTNCELEATPEDELTIRSANERGGFGEAAKVSTVATGISETSVQAAAADKAVYNLQGMRMEKAGKGLYIVGGKKVMRR
ncbi:MAG: hypothetical protein IJ612_00755 [Prevotella sp.]|nr:hypothetical protein [Prevotella sp.]